jgi:hypothetical protein
VHTKSLLATAVLAVALGGTSTTVAFAGEETGTGADTAGPAHARSICTFSGLNDEPEAAFPEGGRTQSWGQFVRQDVVEPSELKSGPPSPGSFCNAHLYPYPPGPPPPPEG